MFDMTIDFPGYSCSVRRQASSFGFTILTDVLLVIRQKAKWGYISPSFTACTVQVRGGSLGLDPGENTPLNGRSGNILPAKIPFCLWFF